MELIYGVTLTPDDELGFVARCRDIPEVLSWAETQDQALEQAADAIEVALLALVEDGAALPRPSAVAADEVPVVVPAPLAAKLALYAAWKEAGISKSALALRMGVGENEVRRILDPRHSTKLERMDEAARALGFRMSVSLRAA